MSLLSQSPQAGRVVLCSEVEASVFGGGEERWEEESETLARRHGSGGDSESSGEEDGGANIPAAEERGREEGPARQGLRKAREREMVRQAGRRGVAFGFEVEEGESRERKMVDAVQDGKMVESSFAKGEWGVRWR